MLKDGDRAPDFDLPRDGGGRVKLSELRGRTVVLYFYPKDDTSGCTKEAVGFTASQAEFAAIGAEVIGVSPDPVASHDRFKDKHGLSVVLVSDPDRQVIDAYDVWVEKQMYGRTYMGVERATFLINGSGRIDRIWRNVGVPGHVGEVLAAAQALAS